MKNLPPEFTKPEVDKLSPDVHPSTLGNWAIKREMEALSEELTADHIEARLMGQVDIPSQGEPRDSGRVRKALVWLGFAEPTDTEHSQTMTDIRHYIGYDISEGLVASLRERFVSTRMIVRQELDMVRDRLRAIEPDKQREAHAAAYRSLSDFQRDQYKHRRSKDPKLTVIDWLIENPALGMPDTTATQRERKDAQQLEDDQRLLNFLQRHNQVIADREQHPRFIKEAQAEKGNWEKGTRRGVREGWLHSRAIRQIKRLKDIKIHEGDYFSTLLEDTAGFFAREYPDRVAVTRESMQEAAGHELNHALLEVSSGDEHSALAQPWFYEALTEEIHLAQQGHELGDFEPQMGTYRRERELVFSILHVANVLGAGVDLADLTYAYSAPRHIQSDLLEDFESKIHQAGFPHEHILAYTSELVRGHLAGISSHPQESQLGYFEQQGLAAWRAAVMVRSLVQPAHKSRNNQLVS